MAIKSGMALPLHEKSGMANATPAIPLLPPLSKHSTEASAPMVLVLTVVDGF